MDNNLNDSIRSKKNVAKMWIFTIIGVVYFMLPFKVDGKTTMCISYLEGKVIDNISAMPFIILLILTLSAVISLVCSTVLKGKVKNEFANKVFVTSWSGLIWRFLGAAILILSYYKIGPSWVYDDNTGGLITFDLIPMLFMLFLLALTFIALLTDFGGLELLGGLLSPLFKPLFKLSGKAAVLSLVSYIGSGTTGMIVTDAAHKRGEFTTKEANIIVFGFAIVSFPVTFAYPTGIAGLGVEYFPPLALCLVVCTIICTVIISRIPPLSKKSSTYYDGSSIKEEVSKEPRMKLAYESALIKAKEAPSVPLMIKEGLRETAAFIIEVFPLIITIATAALAISEFTPIFDYIAIPIAPALNAIGLPEATAAAPSFVLGFADIFLPFIGAATVTSQLTKFVICVVAIMQMYCMSEGIVILLKSSMKINFLDIVVIFIIRTIVSLPIAYGFGILFGIA